MTGISQVPDPGLYGEEVRTFNTAGPCDPKRHYMLPPEPRVPGALYLIDLDEYFVIHAPRQTGKTTTLEALARDINATGERVAVVFSCEQAAAAGDDYDAAIGAILSTITQKALAQGLPAEQMPPSPWPGASPFIRLTCIGRGPQRGVWACLSLLPVP